MTGCGPSWLRRHAVPLAACALLAVLCALLVTGCGQLSSGSSPTEDPASASAPATPATPADGVEGELVVRFINVYQGDCALLSCNGHHVIIDGGPRDASSKVYSILSDIGIEKLDAMVATHPDADHIGGLAAALNAADCKVCYCSESESDGELYTFTKLLETLAKKGCPVVVPQPGDSFAFGGATVTFVGPTQRFESENDNSLVCRVDFGKTSFLFTGDMEHAAEDTLVGERADIAADVLKVAHHGSSSSSTPAFLQAVHPTYAVISVGSKNDYGHPTARTLERLAQVGAKVYRTDLDGSVIMRSDGSKIAIETTDFVSE